MPSGILQLMEEIDLPCISPPPHPPFIGHNRRARNSGGVDAKEEKGSLGGNVGCEPSASFRHCEIGGGNPRFVTLTCLWSVDGLQLLEMSHRNAEIMSPMGQAWRSTSFLSGLQTMRGCILAPG